MLTLADVTNIKCEFVNKLLAFLNKRKYVVDVCPCTLYPYYARLLKVTTLLTPDFEAQDCFDFDEQCKVKSKVVAQTPTNCDATTVDCDSQVTITLTQTGETCNATAFVSADGTPTGSAFPTISVDGDEIIGKIWLGAKFTGDCPNVYSTVLVESGETSSGSTDQGSYKFGYNIPVPSATAYVKTLRLHLTDPLGTDIGFIEADLDPATSPYYADDITYCPGCATVSSTEVQFGNSNFPDAFGTLMDNVATAHSDGNHSLEAVGGLTFKLRCRAYHNPTFALMGLHPTQGRIVLSNGAVYTTCNGFSNLTSSSQDPIRFYYDSATFSPSGTQYDCADISPLLTDQVTYPSVNISTSSFNKINLLSTSGTLPLSVTDTSSCGPTVLTATYTTTETVNSVQWLNPSSNEISTTNIAVADDSGTYTFVVYLANGCSISSEISV